MLLTASGIGFTNGSVSRWSCLWFGILKTALLLRNQMTYNNHEYMYGTLAIALALCDCHDSRFSLFGAWQGYYTMGLCNMYRAVLSVVLLTLLLTNAVYGIPGWIAVCGVIALWLLVACVLGNERRSFVAVSSNEAVSASWDVRYLQVYFAAVYFYAGLAKTDSDWLSGSTPRELLTRWVGAALQSPQGLDVMSLPPFLSGALGWLSLDEDNFLRLFAMCGLLLDLLAGWLLMVPMWSVRLVTTVAVVFFNVTNHWLFVLETFPWVMLSSLVLYHDATWMLRVAAFVDQSCIIFNQKFKISQAMNFLHWFWRRVMRPLSLVLFIFYHLAAPLQCGLASVGDRGSVSWISTCQNFNWRMMSRSASTVASSLRFEHPFSGEVQIATLDMLGLNLCSHSEDLNRGQSSHEGGCSEQREFLAQTPQFEDRLLKVVKNAATSAHSVNGDFAPPRVFAEIWLEINGPPIQRFVRPFVDLASAPPVRATRSWWPHDLMRGAFVRPAPLGDWVLPRIEVFRSMEWLATLRDLVRREKEAFQKLDVHSSEQLRVLFVADVPSSGVCHFHFHRPVILRLLHGVALVEGGLGVVRQGDELRVEGRVSWRAIDMGEECVETDWPEGSPVLWMIVLRNGAKDFEIQPV
jgi:hypothetical protein